MTRVLPHEPADLPPPATDRAGAITVRDAAVVAAHKAANIFSGSIDVYCFQAQIRNLRPRA